MAVTHSVYQKYKLALLNMSPTIDLDAGADIKVALLLSTHVPNLATHEFFSDVAASEIPATGGYTAGGIVIGSRVNGIDGTGFAYFAGATSQWPSFTTADAGFAVIYKDTGVAATSPLVSIVNFGGAQAPNGVTFSLVWALAAAGGILKAA